MSPDADSEELSPEIAREQLALYAENFHRFVLEAIPRLEAAFEQSTLLELLSLAQHYRQSFMTFANSENILARHYLMTADRLVETIEGLLGISD